MVEANLGFFFFVFLLSLAPLAAFAVLVYVLIRDDGDAPTNLLVMPFVLGGIGIVVMVVMAFDKWPKQSREVTDVVAVAGLGLMATRRYQKMRDREQAEALADEIERRERTT